MEYGTREYNDILTDFRKGRSYLNDVTVEVAGDVNELNPLTLLRAYESEPTVDNTTALASDMILNREVVFKKNGETIHSFFYKGGDLAEHFVGKAYLMDLLLKLCYGIMVKKLTPPSEDSVTEERQ